MQHDCFVMVKKLVILVLFMNQYNRCAVGLYQNQFILNMHLKSLVEKNQNNDSFVIIIYLNKALNRILQIQELFFILGKPVNFSIDGKKQLPIIKNEQTLEIYQ